MGSVRSPGSNSFDDVVGGEESLKKNEIGTLRALEREIRVANEGVRLPRSR